MRMLRLAAVTAALLCASCSYECSPATCASGCCDKGLCFEGTHETRGVQCGSTPAPAVCVNTYDACNSRIGLFCCAGRYCDREKCNTCNERGDDCSRGSFSTPCCPGLSCELKPGFSSSYACR